MKTEWNEEEIRAAILKGEQAFRDGQDSGGTVANRTIAALTNPPRQRQSNRPVMGDGFDTDMLWYEGGRPGDATNIRDLFTRDEVTEMTMGFATPEYFGGIMDRFVYGDSDE